MLLRASFRRPGATLRPVEAERIATTGALVIADRSFQPARALLPTGRPVPFLARLGSTRSWRQIALELGLPAWFAEYPPALHQRLVERNRWPAFLADLDKLAGALEPTCRPWTTGPAGSCAPSRIGCSVPSEPAGCSLATCPLTSSRTSCWSGCSGRPTPAGICSWPHCRSGGLTRRRPRPGGAGSKTCARRRRRCCSPLRRSWKPVDGSAPPARWSGGPACGDPAAPDDALTTVWSRSVEQDQDWPFGDHDIALSAALAAAEEDLTEHAFQPWLWRWLDVNYGICNTDDNALWSRNAWALRTALTDPDTAPAVVRHPTLAVALRHTTRAHDGAVYRWQLLRSPPSRPTVSITGGRSRA